MKKIKFLGTFMIILLFSICSFNKVYGISASLSPSPSSVLQGNTFTVKVNLSSDVCAANFNLSYDTSKLTLVSGDTSYAWAEGETLPSYTFKANNSVTGSANISLSGTASDTNYNPSGLSGSTAVTITAPVVTNSTSTTTKTPTTSTSNNANLKKLVPNYEGLSPNFNPAVTKYSLTVPATATSLGLTVAVEGTGAKYWISGDENLKMGDNTVSITVTATDGTKKVYTIIVTKAADVAKANAYLSSIVIDGKTLSPVFTSENLEYDIGTVTSDVEKLTVLAFAQSTDSKIEITGNDKLVDGDNIIKVKVTAVDGTTTKEYTIKVNKEVKSAVTVIASTTSENVDIYGDMDSLKSDTPSGFTGFLDNLSIYLQAYGLMLSLFAFCLFEFVQIVYLYKVIDKIEKENKVKIDETDETIFSRRRNSESENIDTNSSWRNDNNKEEPIDDISDELVDSSNVDSVIKNDTENSEDFTDLKNDDKE